MHRRVRAIFALLWCFSSIGKSGQSGILFVRQTVLWLRETRSTLLIKSHANSTIILPGETRAVRAPDPYLLGAILQNGAKMKMVSGQALEHKHWHATNGLSASH